MEDNSHSSLTPDEEARVGLGKYDSLQFGLVDFSAAEDPEAAKLKQLLLKAARHWTRLLLESQNDSKTANGHPKADTGPGVDPAKDPDGKKVDQCLENKSAGKSLPGNEKVPTNGVFELSIGVSDTKPNKVTLNDDTSRLYLKLGHLYLLLSDFRKSLSAYQHFYRRCDPDEYWKDGAAIFGLALSYYHFNGFALAGKLFRQLLYLMPGFPRAKEVNVRLGLIHKYKQVWTPAIKHLNAALADTTPNASTLSSGEIAFHIAHCFDLQNHHAIARSRYEDILATYVHDMNSAGGLAAHLSPNGPDRSGTSINGWQQSSGKSNDSTLSPEVRSIVLCQLGWLYHRQPVSASESPGDAAARQERAVSYLKESLRINPNSGRAWYYLGRCFSSLPGRAHDAFVAYRHSIDKTESSADTWCSIGVLYQQQHQPMDALQAYICAVQLDSSHTAAWIDLGLLYESSGMPVDALSCYQKAAKLMAVAASSGDAPASTSSVGGAGTNATPGSNATATSPRLNPSDDQKRVNDALSARIRVLETQVANFSSILKKPPAHQTSTAATTSPGGTVTAAASGTPSKLPNLEEAWKLPIPAELTTRQNQATQVKMKQSIDGVSIEPPVPSSGATSADAPPSALQMTINKLAAEQSEKQELAATNAFLEPDKAVEPAGTTALTPQQIQMMQLLQQNQARLNASDLATLRHLQQQYALMEQQKQQQPTLDQSRSRSDVLSLSQSVEPGDLPQVSQEDLQALLGVGGGGLGSATAGSSIQESPSITADDFLLLTAGHQGGGGSSKGGVTKMEVDYDDNDPLLSDAALSAAILSGPGPTGGLDDTTGPGADESLNNGCRIQDSSISSTSHHDSNAKSGSIDSRHSPSHSSKLQGDMDAANNRIDDDDSAGSGQLKSSPRSNSSSRENRVPTPPPLSLSVPIRYNIRQPIVDVIAEAKRRLLANSPDAPPILAAPFVPPRPVMPSAARRAAFAEQTKKLVIPTPSIVIENKREAYALELQDFCYKSPIAVIRGLSASLKLDLGLFSTKTLYDSNPDQQVEVRTQLLLAPDQNFAPDGTPTWLCDSHRSFTTIAKYAQYQAQSFQHALRAERERIRTGSSAKNSAANSEPVPLSYQPFTNVIASNAAAAKRRKTDTSGTNGPPTPGDGTVNGVSPNAAKMLKFGTNVDLSDERKWKIQLAELAKLPAFLKVASACNLLSHVGHVILGMNTVQLYMKVPGARTPGHVENLSFASVNINIGPGDCEWFGVEYEFWGVINQLLEQRGLSFAKGSWWPLQADLSAANVPLYRFTQRPGDVVWVGPGTVHWVQSLGWCNNIAWNVGPFTATQLSIALERYELNKLDAYKSIVPIIHLAWSLSENVRFTDPKLYEIIKDTLLRTLTQAALVVEYVTSAKRKELRHHPRTDGELAHYCYECDVEVWNVLFVTETTSGSGKFVVHCLTCAQRIDPSLDRVTVLIQQHIEDLITAYNEFKLHPKVPGVLA